VAFQARRDRIVTLVPGWHPMVVHFPIALTLSAGAALIAAKLVRRESLAEMLATVGTWNLCAGAVAALVALATGLAGVLDLQVGDAARAAIATHVKWAMFTSVVLLLVAVWRGAGSAPRSRPSWLFVIVLGAVCVALSFTGYFGGENVYRHGVGVERIN
jgi:uncharacterized membrane protein